MRSKCTRRGLLAGGLGAGLIPFPEWFAARAAGQPPKIRYAAHSLAAVPNLVKMRAAVDWMMARSTGEPLGWTFQWYTHAIPPITTKTVQVAALPPGERPLANEVWNTCQAHFGGPLAFFPPWHRMFLFFFERIVGAVIHDTTFALPYWDYGDPKQRAIPGAFQQVQGNALYRPDRNDGSNNTAKVNQGEAIDIREPPGTLNLDCLAETQYQPYGASPGFCAALGQNPHKLVHTLIGNDMGMAAIPWAGNDPVFWIHHANIDRIWASWNAAGGANPSDADWRDKQFVFADETGARVAVSVKDFESVGPLGYVYDRLQPTPRINPPATAPQPRTLAVRPGRAAAAPAAAIALGAGPVVVRLAPPAGARALAGSLEPGVRVLLTLSGLSAAASPGVLYRVYLDPMGGGAPTTAPDRFVGAISFFDDVPMAGMADMPGMAMPGAGSSFVFDVTRLARGAAAVSVSIVPSGRPNPAARPTVGEITLASG